MHRFESQMVIHLHDYETEAPQKALQTHKTVQLAGEATTRPNPIRAEHGVSRFDPDHLHGNPQYLGRHLSHLQGKPFRSIVYFGSSTTRHYNNQSRNNNMHMQLNTLLNQQLITIGQNY